MTFGISFNILSGLLVLTGKPMLMTVGLLLHALGTATFLICLNAYVLDYIARVDLGKMNLCAWFSARSVGLLGHS